MVGTCSTELEHLDPRSFDLVNTRLNHNFLVLHHPEGPPRPCKQDRLKPETTPDYPFAFVVPDVLPLHVCGTSSSINDFDLRGPPPPTLGKQPVRLPFYSPVSDMAPATVCITYSIKASLIYLSGSKRCLLTKTQESVCIVPMTSNVVPSSLGPCSRLPSVDDTGSLRQGRLMLEAVEIPTLRAPVPANGTAPPLPAMAKVRLRYHSKSFEPPPLLGNLAVFLKAITHYSVNHPLCSIFRELEERPRSYAYQRAVQKESFTIRKSRMSNPHWQKITLPEYSQVETTYANDPGALQGTSFWEATLPIPLLMPQSKFLPPTFYTCYVVRTYRLSVAISYQKRKRYHRLARATLDVPIRLDSVPAERSIFTPSIASLANPDVNRATSANSPGVNCFHQSILPGYLESSLSDHTRVSTSSSIVTTVIPF
ncbi:hypothetical protein CNMCM5623_001634 [Aspergillus felis]|uniref:Arrestin-like N-terminal domain-containing protein n=1 Tax=Aspergillus felis TaxID=1287682 RepID=A0A8H6Q980_9EURO|nr:hypothetical protein CNMCM5623_001634 [Aspergillus felis]